MNIKWILRVILSYYSFSSLQNRISEKHCENAKLNDFSASLLQTFSFSNVDCFVYLFFAVLIHLLKIIFIISKTLFSVQS